MLTGQLTAEDRISIAVYAGAAGMVLEPTPGDNKAAILGALDNLQAGGSTNGGAGIELAYRLAEQAFIKDGINRVLLATDGDFNVGTVNQDALISLVADKRKSGVSLSTLGFGSGNLNDALVEQLSNKGNGNYAYIDSVKEARKVLVEEMDSTLQTIAKDVKIQIEFNPAQVREYRLIGYENRLLNREDFNNDKVDAGEIGAGHTVTALYELTLVDSDNPHMDPLRYQSDASHTNTGDELAFLKLRYKAPDGDTSTLLENPIAAGTDTAFEDSSERFRFAAAVAGFAELLRGGENVPALSYANVADMVRDARGRDPHGYRGEMLQLVELAETLSSGNTTGQ